MHDGSMTSLLEVIDHYNNIPNNSANTNLDNRLQRPGNQTQQLNLTTNDKNALVDFLKTLTGSAIYTNEIWSDPFDDQGNISIVGDQLSSNEFIFDKSIAVFPNPVTTDLTIQIETGSYRVTIYSLLGTVMVDKEISGTKKMNLQSLAKGVYMLKIKDVDSNNSFNKKFIKH